MEAELEAPSLSSPPLHNTQSNPEKKELSLFASCSGKVLRLGAVQAHRTLRV